MATAADCAHQEREGRRRPLSAHLPGHYRPEAAHRGGRPEGTQQVCPPGSLGDEESLGPDESVQLTPACHQDGDDQAVRLGTCKLHF